MPTGYTAQIKDGISFQQFAMKCARAFGACVMMRDDPTDKPIPEKFEPSTYHNDELKKACGELEGINGLSVEAGNKQAAKEFTDKTRQQEQNIAKDRKLMNQYRDMLRKVKQWQPPTSDHTEFKEFMINQIERSIKFDGMEDYYIQHPIKKLTGKEWLAKERKRILGDIEYHTKEDAGEIQRTNQRNEWVKALRDSLEK